LSLRILFACVAGLSGMLIYLFVVLWAGDYVQLWHWALQVPFYVLAGFLWVFPVLRLIYWAARVTPPRRGAKDRAVRTRG
jgi:hypothetical protein